MSSSKALHIKHVSMKIMDLHMYLAVLLAWERNALGEKHLYVPS